MRTFAIGDIHGHADKLERILAQIMPLAEVGDTLVFIGDYIDRGPECKRVVQRVLDLKKSDVWPGPVVTLVGNHEDMMLDETRAANGEDRVYDWGLWLENGGGETALSYIGRYSGFVEKDLIGLGFLPDEHREFFHGLDLEYEDEHAHFVHAGFRPKHLPDESSRFVKLWIREPFIQSDYSWGKPVVFGHTPQEKRTYEVWRPGRPREFEPLNRPEKIGIDTGSCYGGPLSAVMLPERRFFSSEVPS